MSFYRKFFSQLVAAFAFALFVAGEDAVSSVIAQRVGGTPITVDSRIKTFVYSPNEIFQVVFNYGFHSYIEFSKGESVRVIAMGDNVNWKIKPVDNKIFVMPMEKEGYTNMLIETSKGRSYAFDLVSKSLMSGNSSSGIPEELKKHDSPLADISYVVRFYYPQSDLEAAGDSRAVEISAPSLSYGNHTNADVVIKPNHTTKNYVFTASSAKSSIVPLQAFDDGSLTYLKFQDDSVLPKIFSVTAGRHGGKVPCKILLLKGYVIINGVHKQLFLDYGDNSVVVSNKAL